MRGAQGPGDARGGRAPARARSRQVYTARRLLAAMILLLVLVLLVPRACQAILGSEDARPRADRGHETPGKAAAGVAGGTEDGAEKANTAENSTDGETTGAKSDADSEEAREDAPEQADGGAKDLDEILFENLSAVVTEPGGDEDLGSGDATVDQTTPSSIDVGDQWHVDRLASTDQRSTDQRSTDQQAPAARRTPSGRQSLGERGPLQQTESARARPTRLPP